MTFSQFYGYDRNKDLIIKLCKKFKLNEPTIRQSCYGDVDIVFQSNLRLS